MAPKIDPEVGCIIPEPGDWPIDPQEDIPISDDRLWIDGCFDFFHHGHAGVMLQARRLGTELLVGLHSDEDIRANKGPTVMNLMERVAAVNACRFSTKCVPYAPYVTSLAWIGHYGCRFVVHGDDITSDASGEDCYRFVKRAGRMKIVPRTPGISTTNLVGRMLMYTKEHFIHSLTDRLAGREGLGSEPERRETGEAMIKRIKEYASAANGKDPYVEVFTYKAPAHHQHQQVNGSSAATLSKGLDRSGFEKLVSGLPPRPGQRIVYVDGGFDLFSSGHIAFLKLITDLEAQHGRKRDWYTERHRSERLHTHGEDYPPAYVVVGVHNDDMINHHRGINYPIMNLFERGLCVVQCRYIHAVIFGAPYACSRSYLSSLPIAGSHDGGNWFPDAVYHGPTAYMPSAEQPDPYADVKALGIFIQTETHEFQEVNAAQIVQRILDRRAEYEERQRKKGMKSVGEGALRREEIEREAEAARLRQLKEVERQYGA